MQRQSNKRYVLTAALLSLTLLIGALAAVGPAWARYLTEVRDSVAFAATTPSVLVAKNAAGEAQTTVSAGTTTFTLTDEGTTGSCRAKLRLFLPQTALKEGADSATIQIKLTTDRETATYTATVTALDEGTPLYKSRGAGWLYTFYDKNQNELSWELSEEANDITITLTVTDENQILAGGLEIVLDKVKTSL